MSPRSKKQSREMREKSHQAILDAALSLFAEFGFHGTSMTKVATRAGISKGLIYDHFESKEELLQTLMEGWFQSIKQMETAMAELPRAADRMRYFLNFPFMSDGPQLRQWQLYGSILLQPGVFENLQDMIREFFEGFIRLLTRELSVLGWEEPENEARFLAAFVDGIIFHSLLWKEPVWRRSLHRYLLERYNLQEER